MINSMNSELICPWFTWAPLLPSWTNFILANKQAPEISYLFSWQSGRCMFICPCIWEGPDVGLKKKKRLLGAIDQSLLPAETWNEMTPPTSSTLGRGFWSVAKPLGERCIKHWPVWMIESAASQARGALVKLGCQILKCKKFTMKNNMEQLCMSWLKISETVRIIMRSMLAHDQAPAHLIAVVCWDGGKGCITMILQCQVCF